MTFKFTYESGKDVLITHIKANSYKGALYRFLLGGYGSYRDILKVEVENDKI